MGMTIVDSDVEVRTRKGVVEIKGEKRVDREENGVTVAKGRE